MAATPTAAPGTAADAGLLTSSEQIFSSNHTLPQIRALHKALHAQVDDKAARLRTQVGGSYRELLGTADAIVGMRDGMDAVQAALERVGARCGRAVVKAKVGELRQFVERDADTPSAGVGQRPGQVARARLLEGCALAVGRVLRGGGDGEAAAKGERLVVAAKVLVLSRLLAKSLADGGLDADVSASVEASKKSLGSLRRRLLRSIEKVLELVGDEGPGREDVLNALCAYSLATSSGARDVLKHFLDVREEAMALAFDVQGGDRERGTASVLGGLELYTKTLTDFQALVPSKLTEALVKLGKNVLLDDEALRQSEGLRLDIYERWCGDDIRFFRPYIRHDDVDGAQARDMFVTWAGKGGEILMRGLTKALERLFDFKSIIEMRTSVLRLWIRDGGKAKGFDSSVMLNKLRGAISRHLLQVLSMKVGKLRLVGSEVAAALGSWQEGVTHDARGLWDSDGLDLDLSEGAAQFTQDLIARLYGRNDAVSKAVTCYQSWHHVIDDVGEVVEQLRRQRWDNDVDEIEDEDTIEGRQQLLSRDDPQTLHDRLEALLEKAFRDLDAQLAKEWDAQKEAAHSGAVAMYFARVLRDIRSRLPKLKAVEGFGLSLVPALHEKIVVAVVLSPLEELATSGLTRKVVAGRSLWEGEPELPTSPSPAAFGFLRNLSAAMGDAGLDIWSPAAVAVLKQHVRRRLREIWLEAIAARVEEGKADGVEVSNGDAGEDTERETDEADADGAKGDEAEEDAVESDEAEKGTPVHDLPAKVPTPAQQKDVLVQWLFDISILRCSLDANTGSKPDDLGDLEEHVFQLSQLDSDAARQRLAKASQEYWKRTSLLFGLLT